jgi:translocator protein
MNPVIALLLAMTICYGVGFIGNLATAQGLSGWYQGLRAPMFAPPGIVFAPVWTVLYGLMGWSLWLLWRSEPSPARSGALAAFAVQLALNGLWPWLFFAGHKLALAFYEILALDLAVVATIVLAARVQRRSAWLLVPYLLWLCFASLLSFSYWKLNPYEGVPPSAIPPVPGNRRTSAP